MNNSSGTQLNHIRGDNLSRLITIEYADGTPFNLIGYTVFFTIKNLDDERADDTNAVFAKSWTSHSDAINGETLLTATASEMNIEPNLYKYDIQIKSLAGAINTVISGGFLITNDVTKRII
jgi:C4-dicarboxylate transporter